MWSKHGGGRMSLAFALALKNQKGGMGRRLGEAAAGANRSHLSQCGDERRKHSILLAVRRKKKGHRTCRTWRLRG